MAQVEVFGTAQRLPGRIDQMSDSCIRCLIEALASPADKRFQRFFELPENEFRDPPDRSAEYTIIEVVLFEGRSVTARKRLYELLYDGSAKELAIMPVDVDIVVIRAPP